jgi:site-specific recombinase XerD
MTIAVDEIRRITLRVPSQLHQVLTEVATERDVSLNRLAIEALEQYVIQEKKRFPLKELSDLMAPAAQAKGLTEEALMRHVKEARRRIWQERYREMVELSRKAQAT